MRCAISPRARGRSLGIAGACVAVSIAVGCATLGPQAYPPSWWDNPHKHDDEHLYFKAQGSSEKGVEQARQEALVAIKAQIAQYICEEVTVQRGATPATSTFASKSVAEVRNVEVFDEKDGRDGRVWLVWMLGRYPRADYNQVKKELALGDELQDRWARARSALDRKGFEEAESLLSDVLKRHGLARGLPFSREDVMLELARLCADSGKNLQARQWLADVQNSAVPNEVRARADAMAARLPAPTVGDAFRNRTVGLCCLKRVDGTVKADPALAQEVQARMTKERLQSVICPVEYGIGEQSYDPAALKRLATSKRSLGVDALFVTVLDIDTSRTGKKIDIPFTSEKADALDANLRYMVVRTSDGQLLASDSTSGYSSSPSHLLTVILTHARHIPKYAPSIAAGLSTSEAGR